MKKSEEIKKNCEKLNASKEKEIARLEELIANAQNATSKAKENIVVAMEKEDAEAYTKANSELSKNQMLMEMYAKKIEAVKSAPVLDDAVYKEYVDALYNDSKGLFVKTYSSIRAKLTAIEKEIRALLDDNTDNIFTLEYIQRIYNYKDCDDKFQRGSTFLGREKPGDKFVDFYLADIVRGIQNTNAWLNKNGVK